MREKVRDINSARRGGPPSRSQPPRRLAAIVAGDIAGYSRLMELDEEETHERVKSIQRDLIEPTIAEHHGRLVKTTGDGFFAVFDSPVEAVRCGIVIQQNMFGRNALLEREQRIEYRIGVNLGDVIIEATDIYGDGVNIASRLESIAEPGEVYISGGMYEQIKNKLVCGYQSLGDRKVKNITDPISVYRVLPDPEALVRARSARRWPLAAVASTVLAILLIVGAGWYFLVRPPMEMAARRAAAPASAPVAAAPEAAPNIAPAPAAPVPAPATSAPPAAADSAAPPRQAAIEAPPPAVAAPLREPEMVSLPGGSFTMGSNEDPSEKPVHRVTVRPFAIGKYPVTLGEWRRCVAAKACAYAPPPGEDEAPVANLSWNDAQQYVRWLAQATGKPYRLPSEAEWEYAARGGTETKYWWGNTLEPQRANCKGCNQPYDAAQPLKVGSFPANPFGLHDMGGGVDEWVADCWHASYHGAPADGSAWTGGDCFAHVLRGGSWRNDPSYVRPASRDSYDTAVRYPTHGLRVARSP